MVRKGRYKPSRGGPTYLNRDNVRLKVVKFLHKVGRSNQNKMMNDSEAGLRGQKWINLANVLDEMCVWDWIKKEQSEDAANVKVYELKDKGRDIANLLNKLEETNSDVFKLDSFHGIKQPD